jgi:hypothetical protein
MRTLLSASLVVVAMGMVSGCQVDDTYAVCNVTADCNDADDTCFGIDISGVSSGNFCSHQCVDDFDCESAFGFAGACYLLGRRSDDVPLCFQTCREDFDCYASSICVEAVLPSGFSDFICVPDN